MKHLKTDKTRKMQAWFGGASIVMLLAALMIGTFIKNGQDAADHECMETLEVMPESMERATESVVHTEVPEREGWEDAETETWEETGTIEAVEDTDAGSQVGGENAPEKSAKQEVSAPFEESMSHPGEVFEEDHKEATKENTDEDIDITQTEDITDATEPEHIQESTTDEMPKMEPEVSAEVEKHEHNWMFESYYQNPTCSNGGLVTEICAQCGETQITGGIPTGKHSFKVETKGDCCSEEVVACSECNFREVRDKDPKNHIDIEDGFCYGCGQKVE